MADSWFDQSKIAAALAQQQSGADGRKSLTGDALLSAMNPIAAPKYVPATTRWERDSGGDYHEVPEPGYFVSSNGTKLPSADGKTFTDSYDNPAGQSNRDQADVTYEVRDGQAVPIKATPRYQPGDWVDTGRPVAQILGTVLSAGAAGYAAAAYGGAGAAAGTTATETGGGLLGGGSGGLSSADLAALHSASGYGASTAAEAGFAGLGGTTAGGAAGLSAAEIAALPGAYGSGVALQTANPGLWSQLTPAQQSMVTKGGLGALTSAAQGGNIGQGAAMGAAGGYLDSNGQLISGVNNSSLLQAGVGLLGAAAGAAGSKGGLNSATTTDQHTVDPRVGQYVYGQDGNSGLLGKVNGLMDSQLATGGLNATQTQGLNMQLSALQDPAYSASLQQMRNTGAGLLSTPQAVNPFTAGQSGAPPAQTQSAPPAMPPGWQPMPTQLQGQMPGQLQGQMQQPPQMKIQPVRGGLLSNQLAYQ